MIGFTMTPSHIDYSKIITPEVREKLIVGECVILTGFAKELAPVDYGQLKNSIMWATAKSSGGLNEGSEGGMSSGSAKYTKSGKRRNRKARQSNTSAFNYLDEPNDDSTGYVGSNLEYARPVEHGRKDMPNYPRQPYLRPAIDYSKKVRESRRSKVVKVAIEEAYKPGAK